MVRLTGSIERDGRAPAFVWSRLLLQVFLLRVINQASVGGPAGAFGPACLSNGSLILVSLTSQMTPGDIPGNTGF